MIDIYQAAIILDLMHRADLFEGAGKALAEHAEKLDDINAYVLADNWDNILKEVLGAFNAMDGDGPMYVQSHKYVELVTDKSIMSVEILAR
jgi:hypothetical protein